MYEKNGQHKHEVYIKTLTRRKRKDPTGKIGTKTERRQIIGRRSSFLYFRWDLSNFVCCSIYYFSLVSPTFAFTKINRGVKFIITIGCDLMRNKTSKCEMGFQATSRNTFRRRFQQRTHSRPFGFISAKRIHTPSWESHSSVPPKPAISCCKVLTINHVLLKFAQYRFSYCPSYHSEIANNFAIGDIEHTQF